MKIWLVWEVIYGIPFSRKHLLGLYQSEESALKVKAELDASNTDPVVGDDYGPFQGTDYKLFENEVLP